MYTRIWRNIISNMCLNKVHGLCCSPTQWKTEFAISFVFSLLLISFTKSGLCLKHFMVQKRSIYIAIPLLGNKIHKKPLLSCDTGAHDRKLINKNRKLQVRHDKQSYIDELILRKLGRRQALSLVCNTQIWKLKRDGTIFFSLISGTALDKY
jgi:hypothetical protein